MSWLDKAKAKAKQLQDQAEKVIEENAPNLKDQLNDAVKKTGNFVSETSEKVKPLVDDIAEHANKTIKDFEKKPAPAPKPSNKNDK